MFLPNWFIFNGKRKKRRKDKQCGRIIGSVMINLLKIINSFLVHFHQFWWIWSAEKYKAVAECGKETNTRFFFSEVCLTPPATPYLPNTVCFSHTYVSTFSRSLNLYTTHTFNSTRISTTAFRWRPFTRSHAFDVERFIHHLLVLILSFPYSSYFSVADDQRLLPALEPSFFHTGALCGYGAT